MPKFKVYLQQYVEMIAEIEVEATDENAAQGEALLNAHKAEWAAGDDAYKAEVYQVDDAAGEVLWTR